MPRQSRVVATITKQQTNQDSKDSESKNEDSHSVSSSKKSINKRSKTHKFRKKTFKKQEEAPVPQPFPIPKDYEDLKREAAEQLVKQLDQPLRTQLYIRETAKKRLEDKLAYQLN